MSKIQIHYLTAAWCAPCKALKPEAKKLAEQYGALFLEVDIDTMSGPNYLGVPIQSAPTIFVIEGDYVRRILPGPQANIQNLRAAVVGLDR